MTHILQTTQAIDRHDKGTQASKHIASVASLESDGCLNRTIFMLLCSYILGLRASVQKEEAEILGWESSFKIELVFRCNCLVYRDAGLRCDSPVSQIDLLTI